MVGKDTEREASRGSEKARYFLGIQHSWCETGKMALGPRERQGDRADLGRNLVVQDCQNCILQTRGSPPGELPILQR